MIPSYLKILRTPLVFYVDLKLEIRFQNTFTRLILKNAYQEGKIAVYLCLI